MAEGPSAIRPALRVHLQQPQIDAKLNLFPPVLRLEPAHYNLARLVIPLVQEMRYIEIHYRNMAADSRKVNDSAGETRNL